MLDNSRKDEQPALLDKLHEDPKVTLLVRAVAEDMTDNTDEVESLCNDANKGGSFSQVSFIFSNRGKNIPEVWRRFTHKHLKKGTPVLFTRPNESVAPNVTAFNGVVENISDSGITVHSDIDGKDYEVPEDNILNFPLNQ